MMIQIGRYNRLTIAKERSVGFFFDGGEAGDILMPKRHQPEHCAVGDTLDVFIFRDAEDRLTATVRQPYAQVGEVAWLKVVDTQRIGAFLDWGMTKDLLVPLREQVQLMVPGQSYLVRILLDDQNRIIGTTRLENYLQDRQSGEYEYGQAVDLLIGEENDLGFRVIVNHSHWGQLYHSEIFQKIETGQRLSGYIRKLRDDGKIDVALQKPGFSHSRRQDLASQILTALRREGGFLALHDKSPPEAIQARFQISKKQFKQAIGKLYKDRIIAIEAEGLRLLSAHQDGNA